MSRSTAEVVVLLCAATIAVVVVAATVAVLAAELADPGNDTTAVVAGIGSAVSVLCGLVVGFLAGRRTP